MTQPASSAQCARPRAKRVALVAKLRDCAAEALPSPVVDRVIGLVQSLETLPDVTPLCEALEGTRA